MNTRRGRRWVLTALKETRSMIRASLDAAKVGIEAPPTLCDRAKCEFRVATGCCEGGYSSSCQLHSALSVHGGARDRVSIQSVATLSVWRASRSREEHSRPASGERLRYGCRSTLPVALCDATQAVTVALHPRGHTGTTVRGVLCV